MSTYKTENRHGYSVKFSPNRSDFLAIATSQYYGFKGGGTLFLVAYDSDKRSITKNYEFSWEDGLFDVVWSRNTESLLVTGSGDGTLQMWNYKKCPAQVIISQIFFINRHYNRTFQQKPVAIYNEHKKEVCSVDWCQNTIDDFLLSASWDCSVKLVHR